MTALSSCAARQGSGAAQMAETTATLSAPARMTPAALGPV